MALRFYRAPIKINKILIILKLISINWNKTTLASSWHSSYFNLYFASKPFFDKLDPYSWSLVKLVFINLTNLILIKYNLKGALFVIPKLSF